MPHISPPRAIATGFATAIAGAAMVGGLVLAAPSMAAAEESPSPSSSAAPEEKTDAQREERAKKLCARLPEVEKRVAKRLETFTGDAETKGSVANLQARAEKARQEGDEERAKHLDQLATVRKERIDVLKARQPLLADAREFCENKGLLGDGS